MKSADTVTDFEKYYHSKFPKSKTISVDEIALLYIFAKWLDRKLSAKDKRNVKNKSAT